MDKSTYSKKLSEHKSKDSEKKKDVKTGAYNKDDKYYIVFYTTMKDAKVKDYVKSLGGKYRPDLIHVDENGNKLSSEKRHGWLVEPTSLSVTDLNRLIEYGTDNESLVNTLQSEHINYDPDKPKSPEKQTMEVKKPVETKTNTKTNEITNNITISFKNTSNDVISTVKAEIVTKINDFNYITSLGEIVKTSRGWQFVNHLNTEIQFDSVNSSLEIPKEATLIGTLTNAYSEMTNLLTNSESPDCDDDD